MGVGGAQSRSPTPTPTTELLQTTVPTPTLNGPTSQPPSFSFFLLPMTSDETWTAALIRENGYIYVYNGHIYNLLVQYTAC